MSVKKALAPYIFLASAPTLAQVPQRPVLQRPAATNVCREVALNPQPLHERQRLAALNPQPLPPVDEGKVVAALNPQPLPPVDEGKRTTALNPQPLPPVDERKMLTALNPQPLPPNRAAMTAERGAALPPIVKPPRGCPKPGATLRP